MSTMSKGSTLKLAISLSCDDVHMSDMTFDLYFYTSTDNIIQLSKTELGTDEGLVYRDLDTYVAVLNSDDIGEGQLTIKADVQIPDSECPGGKRREIKTMITNIRILK